MVKKPALPDVSADKCILRETYYKTIEDNLSNPIRERKLMEYISKYRDKYIGPLSSPYIYDYTVFTEDDFNIVFMVCGLDKRDVEKTVKSIEYIVKDNKTGSNKSIEKKNFTAFNAIMVLVMRYYILKNDKNKLKTITAYYGYSMYWTLFARSFKKFKPNYEVMVYTVNNLTNKYILKQVGSVDGMIQYGMDLAVTTYEDRIKRCSDDDIVLQVDAFKTRIGGYIKNVADMYYKNYEKKNAIFSSKEVLDDGSTVERDTIIGDVEGLSQRYTTKFFSSEPSMKIVNLVSRYNSVSTSDLKNTLYVLSNSNNIDEVKSLYSSLFYIFLNSNNNLGIDQIQSAKFLAVMDSIYKKGNSNDKNVITVKQLLDKWLKEGSETYRSTSRLGTQNSFRKAIFQYFIFTVAFNE